MSITVCLCANSLYYPDGGGHRWVYLNWALGLQSLGCEIIWLELVMPDTPVKRVQDNLAILKNQLQPYGLADKVALTSWTDEPLSADAMEGCLPLEAATHAHLLLNFQYSLRPDVVRRFPRSVLLDVDPGLLQIWISQGRETVAPHNVYCTIGETVGQPGSGIPDTGLTWQHTPPCVALDWWPTSRASADASFTTVVNWWACGWVDGTPELDNKRSGFLPYLDLPRRTTQRFELAVNLGPDDEEKVIAEKQMLKNAGWHLCHSRTVSSTPGDYQRYLQHSMGEFSCAKPSYVRLQNAWFSDRTVCYLASGKPAVVQHTGPSRFLPDAAGLFRFRDPDEAAKHVATVADDYDNQCKLARSLAEEYFDAKKVAGRVLEMAMG